jgi:hypothetical protein
MGEDEGFFNQGISREARLKKLKKEEEEYEPGFVILAFISKVS